METICHNVIAVDMDGRINFLHKCWETTYFVFETVKIMLKQLISNTKTATVWVKTDCFQAVDAIRTQALS